MKLIIAIIQDEDASEVISHLNEAKFQVTRLSTKGGFLRAGNTTIMTASQCPFLFLQEYPPCR